MTLKIDLSPDKEAALKQAAHAQGITAEQWLERVVDERLRTEAPVQEDTPPGRSLSARVRDLWTAIPEEVRAECPDPRRIDHYVYGLPEQ